MNYKFAAAIVGASMLAAPAAHAAIDLSTGQAAWTLQTPDDSTGLASTIAPNNAWTTFSGASWIGPSDGSQNDPVGDYIYSIDFTLSGSSDQDIEVRWSSDNGANLELTGSGGTVAGTETPSTSGRGTFTDSYTAIYRDLTAGSYTLSASVVNLCPSALDDGTACGEPGWNPTGFIASAQAQSGSIAEVPIPASLALVLGGLGMLAGFGAIRRN